MGGPYGLDEDESLSTVLRKQLTFEGEWTVTVDFEPESVGQGAGVGVWWSKWANASIEIRGVKDNTPSLVFRYAEPDGDSFTVSCYMVELMLGTPDIYAKRTGDYTYNDQARIIRIQCERERVGPMG